MREVPNQDERKREHRFTYEVLKDVLVAWPSIIRLEGVRRKDGKAQARARHRLDRTEKSILRCSGFVPDTAGWWTYAPTAQEGE